MPQRKSQAYCSFCRRSYRDVGPLVEGPGEVYICGECIELCQTIIDQEKRRRGQTPRVIGNAEDLRASLDQIVFGEIEAKEALVEAVIHQREQPGPQQPVLLIGPNASSKAFLARSLAHAICTPFAEGDGLALEPSDAIGKMEPLLKHLLDACDYDIEAAQGGVVYVDGAEPRSTQETLVRLWEGAISNPIQKLELQVSRILFICGAIFPALEEDKPVTKEALLALGALPEWVQRLQAIVRVGPLGEETLRRVLPCVDFVRLISREL